MKRLVALLLFIATGVLAQNADFTKGIVTVSPAVLPNSPPTLAQVETMSAYFAGTGLKLSGNTFSVDTNYINTLIALFNLANGVPSVSQNGALSITNLTVGNSASASFANQATTAVRASQLTGFIVTNNTSQPAGQVSSNFNTITIGSAASGSGTPLSNIDNSIIITQLGGTNIINLPTSNGTISTGYAYNSVFAGLAGLASTLSGFIITNVAAPAGQVSSNGNVITIGTQTVSAVINRMQVQYTNNSVGYLDGRTNTVVTTGIFTTNTGTGFVYTPSNGTFTNLNAGTFDFLPNGAVITASGSTTYYYGIQTGNNFFCISRGTSFGGTAPSMVTGRLRIFFPANTGWNPWVRVAGSTGTLAANDTGIASNNASLLVDTVP